jgi:hypothetical protein
MGAPSFSPAFGERMGAGNPLPEGRHKHGAPLIPAVGMSGIRFFPPRQFIRSILISHTFENREYVGTRRVSLASCQ